MGGVGPRDMAWDLPRDGMKAFRMDDDLMIELEEREG